MRIAASALIPARPVLILTQEFKVLTLSCGVLVWIGGDGTVINKAWKEGILNVIKKGLS